MSYQDYQPVPNVGFRHPQETNIMFPSRVRVGQSQRPSATIIQTHRPLYSQVKVIQLPERLVRVNHYQLVHDTPAIPIAAQQTYVNTNQTTYLPPNNVQYVNQTTYLPTTTNTQYINQNNYLPATTNAQYINQESIRQNGRVDTYEQVQRRKESKVGGGYNSNQIQDGREYVDEDSDTTCCIPFWWLLCLGLATALLFGGLLYYLNSGNFNRSTYNQGAINSGSNAGAINGTTNGGANGAVNGGVINGGTNGAINGDVINGTTGVINGTTSGAINGNIVNVDNQTSNNSGQTTNGGILIPSIPPYSGQTTTLTNTSSIPATITNPQIVQYNVIKLSQVDKYNCPLYRVVQANPTVS